jgi:ADP-heptose:LPS heptosyltransferase
MTSAPAQRPFSVVIPIVAGIGNALMAQPLVMRLKEARPNSRIVVVAKTSAMGEVFTRCPAVDQVRVMEQSTRRTIRLLRQLRREAFDLCLVPFPSNRWQYNVFALACGAAQRLLHRYPVGYVSGLGLVPALRVPAVRGIHDVVQNLRLLEAIGIDPGPTRPPRFEVTEPDRRAAEALLRDAGLETGDAPIAVHAGSARTILAAAKRWPAESYTQLIASLEAQFGPRIVLLEGPDEAGVGEEISRHLGDTRLRLVRLGGSLGVAAAVLEKSALYAGSDSGLAHLAAAVGKPAVTIFAPADPERVCPFGCRDLVVQAPSRGQHCSPCLEYPWNSAHPKVRCREPYCVRDVSVEAVLDAVKRAAQRP